MNVNTLALFLTAICLISCNPNHEISVEDARFDKYFYNKGNIPIVKGKVQNLSPEEIQSIKIAYSLVTPFEQNHSQIRKFGELDSDGSFSLEIEYPFPFQQIWLSVGDLYYAGIYANTELFIEMDADSLRNHRAYMNGPGVTYSSSDGELNTLMNNRVLYKPEIWREVGREVAELIHNRELSYSDFKLKYDSLYSILFKSDDEYIMENPSDFAWLIRNERKSDYYANLCIKHWIPAIKLDQELFREIKKHKSYLVSNSGSSFYSYLFTYLNNQSIYSHKDYLIDCKDYSLLTVEEKKLLSELIQINKQIKENQPYDTLRHRELSEAVYVGLQDTLATYRTLKLVSLLDSLFDAPKADLLKLKISSNDPREHELKMKATLPSVKTNWCYEVIQKRIEENKLKLSAIDSILNNSKSFISNVYLGHPITEMDFGAKLYRVDTLDPKQLLGNIKSANRNKGIIIDFWATWCSPCLDGLPHSKKLYDETVELPREFVYLCTSSSSFDHWKAKIAEIELAGTHIFVEEKINSELMDLLSVSGFPSYVFIDREGNYRPGAITRPGNMSKNDLIELLK